MFDKLISMDTYLDTLWSACSKATHDHYYFVGAKEQNRSSVVEAILANYIIS